MVNASQIVALKPDVYQAFGDWVGQTITYFGGMIFVVLVLLVLGYLGLLAVRFMLRILRKEWALANAELKETERVMNTIKK